MAGRRSVIGRGGSDAVNPTIDTKELRAKAIAVAPQAPNVARDYVLAADTIDSLRAELKAWKDAINDWYICNWANEEPSPDPRMAIHRIGCHIIDQENCELRADLAKAKAALTFTEFREANVKRCIKWHPQGIASWSPSDWLTAVTGELGELASLLKMRNRERDGLVGNKFSPTQKQIADELADVVTYLDLLAEVLGVDLGEAIIAKFNEVSERVGFPDRIARRTLAEIEGGTKS